MIICWFPTWQSWWFNVCVYLCKLLTLVLGNMVGLKPSDVPPPLGVKMASAGAAACIADIVTFPLDTAKVRLQVCSITNLYLSLVSYNNIFFTFTAIMISSYSKSGHFGAQCDVGNYWLSSSTFNFVHFNYPPPKSIAPIHTSLLLQTVRKKLFSTFVL